MENIHCTVVEIIKKGVTKPQKSVEMQSELKEILTNKMLDSDIQGMFRALVLVKKRVFTQPHSRNELILLMIILITRIY